MFNQTRPSFGGSTGFSFGNPSTTQTGFGGSSTFGRPAFGAQITPAVPQTFSGSQQQTQSTGFSGFGTSSTGGTSLFGTSTPQTGGLFGQASSTSGGAFGTTTSGFGSGGGLFSNQNQQNATNTTGGFGAPAAAPVGTTVKFNPVVGSDTMSRNNITTNIQTKIEVITCMKEYENKSLEELRVEDLLAGRRGPSQGSVMTGFGQPASTAQTGGGLFGTSATSGTGLFGAKPATNQSLFGTSTGNSTFGFNNTGTTTQTPSLFGQPQQTQASTGFGGFGGFGSNTTTSAGGGLFNQNKPAFGAATTTPSLFGQPQQQTQQSTGFGGFGGFGTNTSTSGGGLFGQNKPAFGTATSSTGLFNKPAGTGFGTSTGFGTAFGTSSTASPFGTSTAATPFGTNTSTSSTGLFGQQNKSTFSFVPSTGGFGSNTTSFGTGSTGLFGQNQNKTGTLNFGTGFGMPAATSGGGLFGTGNTTTPFGTNTGTAFNTGATNTGIGGFGTSTFNTGIGMPQLQQNNAFGTGTAAAGNGSLNSNNIWNLIKALTHNPFGNSSLMKNGVAPTGKANELISPSSNPTSEVSTSSASKPTYVLPSVGGANRPKPIPLGRQSGQLNGIHGKQQLFVGLDDVGDGNPDDMFKSRPNNHYPSVKKLNLKVFKNNLKNSTADETEGGASPSPAPLTTPIVFNTSNRDDTSTPDMSRHKAAIKRPDKSLDDSIVDLNLPGRNVETPARCADTSGHFADPEANKENQDISIFETSDDGEHNLSNVSVVAQLNATGIKLTKKGYYTLPSLDELVDLVEDNRCLVENFTVGRYRYGNVCFLGVTDVYGLDLDKLVNILRKEIEVYPEGTDKPPQNQGLNKQSIITLDCVWPVDKSTREVIRIPERLDAMHWSDYLERQCLKMDSSFVEYRPETGSWVFKVKHFSKYGLYDEDEEDPKPTQALPPSHTDIPTSQAIKRPHGTMMAETPRAATTPIAGGLFTMRSGTMGGPPTAALATSPVPVAMPQLQQPIAVQPSLSTQTFLDGTVYDSQPLEQTCFDIAAMPEESANYSIMSPNCERLAVSSRAPARAVQMIKSQMFMMEDEQDLEDSSGPTVGHGMELEVDKRPLPPLVSADLESRATPVRITDRRGTSFYDADMTIPEQEKRPPAPPTLRDLQSDYISLPSGRSTDAETGIVAPSHIKKTISLHESISNDFDRCLSDIAAFKGRSFRVGWGPNWTLVHGGQGLNIVSDPEPSQVDSVPQGQTMSFLFEGDQPVQRNRLECMSAGQRKVQLERIVPAADIMQQSTEGRLFYETCLDYVLKCCERVDMDTDEKRFDTGKTADTCPLFRPQHNTALLHHLADAADQFESYDCVGHVSTILNLCVALWGNMGFYSADQDGDSDYSLSMARVEALSQWLERTGSDKVVQEVEDALESSDAEDYLSAIYSYLTNRQVSDACVLAQSKGDHHLALLLSQSCLGEEGPRQIMKSQLDNWASSATDRAMNVQRLRLYTLLAATPIHKASDTIVNVFKDLDWKRSLAVHLWYICSSVSTIAEVLSAYEIGAGLTDAPTKYCAEPFPDYAVRDGIQAETWDVCYHLLKLYTDPTHRMEELLDVATITSDPIDVTVSWFLWKVLESLGYNHLSEIQCANLHLNMAALLEASGNWHWAVFVVLCIQDEYRREQEAKSIIGRHVCVDTDSDNTNPAHSHTDSSHIHSDYAQREQFLIHNLGVPAKWLHQAKATKARSEGLIDQEAWYLILSEDYNRAHSLVIDTIAPNAIINEDHAYLGRYLDAMNTEDKRARIMDWEGGGSVYVNYLEVCELVAEMKKSRVPTASKVEKLRPRLLELCKHLDQLKSPTSKHRLCIAEMSRVVIGVLRAVLGEEAESNNDRVGATQVLARQISTLPLTHDYALDELNLIVMSYLKQFAKDS